jgi:hypothetical protein
MFAVVSSVRKSLGYGLLFGIGCACAQADWVRLGADGKLAYKKDARGNRVMDFSSAGYMGGGVALPQVSVKVTVTPSGGDDRAAIQAAVDKVSRMPLQGGFRGAVELGAGTFKTGGPVLVGASGVVVRGAGSGKNGTLIQASGGKLFSLAGTGSFSLSGSVDLTETYIPSGAMSVNVKDASGFKVGDEVVVAKEATKEWIAFMGMDTLVRDGDHQTWLAVGTRLNTVRNIVAIAGNKLTFDAPLTDNFDAAFLGNPVGTVSKYAFPGRITQCGLEHLQIAAPANAEPFGAVAVDAAMDCWVRDVSILDGTGNFQVGQNARRITVEGVSVNHTVPSVIVAKPADFTCTGTQVLFNKCRSAGEGSWTWTTGGRGTGPIVILNFKSTQNLGITPHMRWTTGILADCDTLPNAPKNNPGLSYRNRATAGSGHGWTAGWSVAWNVVTPYFLVSKAPGTLNWAIGGKGEKTSLSDSDGVYDHLNTMVEPRSLYLRQLQERLGPQALADIGYGSTAVRRDGMVERNRARVRQSGRFLLFDLAEGGEVTLGLYGADGGLRNSMSFQGIAGANRVDLKSWANGAVGEGPRFIRFSSGARSALLPFYAD